MRETRSSGSVEGVLSNGHLYSDCIHQYARFSVAVAWTALPWNRHSVIGTGVKRQRI